MTEKSEKLATHIIVGTAGHIDHGKTSLVQSLTGTNPDRLKEEIERGMTIDLGFAFLGESITIIDVPGHEKFVKTMVAGVNTIDIALLVIAADDGIMPQTIEHLEILNLLKIPRGIIALTKIDIVEPGWADMVAEDIRNLVKDTFLKDAPIIQVSNITNAGIDTLKTEIVAISKEILTRKDKGVFRLLIDRVFSIKGFGTVVAGTVLSGKVAADDTVELLPQGVQLRVRGVQVHEKNVIESNIGFRTAINIGGIEKDLIDRGNVLAEPGYFKPSKMVDASFLLLTSWGKTLENRTRVRIHIGTNELIARIILLDKKDFRPGDEGFVQFHFESPVVADFGDRFVVRSYSPLRTMGGGMILDTAPAKHKQLQQEVIDRLKRLVKGDPNQVLLEFFDKDRFMPKSADDMAKAIGLTKEDVEKRIAVMEEIRQIVRIGKKRFMSKANYDALRIKIVSIVDAFHQEDPLHFAMPAGKLCLMVKPAADRLLFDEIVTEYRTKGIFIIDGDQVRLASRHVTLSPKQQEYFDLIEARFLKEPLDPPGFDDILNEMGEKVRKLLQYMVESGAIIPVEKGIYFHAKALADVKGRIEHFFTQKKEATIGDMKELFAGASRKKLVMILEHFDRIGLTVRVGEARQLRS